MNWILDHPIESSIKVRILWRSVSSRILRRSIIGRRCEVPESLLCGKGNSWRWQRVTLQLCPRACFIFFRKDYRTSRLARGMSRTKLESRRASQRTRHYATVVSFPWARSFLLRLMTLGRLLPLHRVSGELANKNVSWLTQRTICSVRLRLSNLNPIPSTSFSGRLNIAHLV